MERRDERSRRLSPDALGVAERRTHELLGVARDLLERERLDARFGEAVFDAVLPRGLHALHVDRGALHVGPQRRRAGGATTRRPRPPAADPRRRSQTLIPPTRS